MEVQRCTGHCCKQFSLPHSPDLLEKDYQVYLKWAKDQSNPHPRFKETHIVSQMVIHIGEGKIVSGKFIEGKTGSHIYTCKHYNTETGNCMNYEGRPEMCKDYPYGDVCSYAGCTLKMVEDVCCKKGDSCSACA